MFYSWFTVAMIYYGLVFSGHNLNIAPHKMMYISGAVELLSLPFNIFLLNRFVLKYFIIILTVNILTII